MASFILLESVEGVQAVEDCQDEPQHLKQRMQCNIEF